jgi:hypothetical protein
MECAMRLKKLLLLAGVAAIPAWYGYRTLTDHRFPRLEFNRIFMTENDLLREEIRATEKKAQEDLAKLAEESSIKSEQQRSANEIRACIDFSKKVRADFDAFVEEEKRWKSEVEPLLHTRAGAAIVENEDYVRAFKEFYRSPTPEERLKAYAAEIDGITQKCEESGRKNPPDVYLFAEKDRLEQLEKEYGTTLANRIEGRRKIEVLAQIAGGQAPQTVATAIERQQIREMVEDYKAQREWERIVGHRGLQR